MKVFCQNEYLIACKSMEIVPRDRKLHEHDLIIYNKVVTIWLGWDVMEDITFNTYDKLDYPMHPKDMPRPIDVIVFNDIYEKAIAFLGAKGNLIDSLKQMRITYKG